MKKNQLKLLLIFFIIFTLILTGNVLAQSNTDIEDDSPASPATTEALKDIVGKVAEEKKSPENSDEIKRGFIGLVERVSEEAITFSNAKGTQIVPINDQVTLEKNDKNIEIKDIEIEDSAIILGIQKKDDFTPIKIIFSEKNLRPKSQLVLIGALTEIDTKQITIESRKEAKEHQIILNTQTEYEDITEEEIDKTDLFEKMQMIVAGFITTDEEAETETKTAKIIRALVQVE